MTHMVLPVVVDAKPAWGDGTEVKLERDLMDRLNDYLNRSNAVLLGSQVGQNSGHAVSWFPDEDIVFDPRGDIYPIENFAIQTIILLC